VKQTRHNADHAFGVIAMNDKPSRGPLVLSILIITVGIGWLLTAQGYGQGINWVWTLGLGVAGIMAFVISGGIDKISIIVGPFFLTGSVLVHPPPDGAARYGHGSADSRDPHRCPVDDRANAIRAATQVVHTFARPQFQQRRQVAARTACTRDETRVPSVDPQGDRRGEQICEVGKVG